MIITIPDFLDPIRCEEIIREARPRMEISGVWENGKTVYTDYRKSWQTWLHLSDFGGQVQVVNYKTGGYYKEHTDDMKRKLTILVYLNTVPKGGATYFRKIEQRIEPQVGKAVVWPSSDPETLHEAEPVLEGEKWIMTKWF